MNAKAVYTNKPIGSIESLARALKTQAIDLLYIAENSARYYKPNKPEIKASGGIRQHFTVSPDLKKIQSSIVNNIFKAVMYPKYLHGALKGRTPSSSAEHHLKRKLLVKEDISNFFDSITSDEVEKMWLRLFNFPPDVASTLTKLTTLNQVVPQGAPTSSYIANLILWDVEPTLVANLEELGFRYTRFVDDVTISTNKKDQDLTPAVSAIYRMFFSKGLKPKRQKHEVQPSGSRQEVQGILTNNRKPALSKDVKCNIRSDFRLLNLLHEKDKFSDKFRAKYASFLGKLHWLKQFHPASANRYLNDLKKLKPSLSKSEKQWINTEIMRLEAIVRRDGCITVRSAAEIQSRLDAYGLVDNNWIKPYRRRLKALGSKRQ